MAFSNLTLYEHEIGNMLLFAIINHNKIKRQHNKVLFLLFGACFLCVFVFRKNRLKLILFECKVFHFIDVYISQYRLLCNLCFSHNR